MIPVPTVTDPGCGQAAAATFTSTSTPITQIRNNTTGSTLYPLHPSNSQVLFRHSDTAVSLVDRIVVAASSLFIVGSVVWVPLTCFALYRKIKALKDPKRRKQCTALCLLLALLIIAGPHRSPRFGKFIHVRKWKLWNRWLKFIAMEVILDRPNHSKQQQQHQHQNFHDYSTNNTSNEEIENDKDDNNENAFVAFVPHGIVPFAFAFGIFPELAQRFFGLIRPIVASATQCFPVVRDILRWCECVDASQSSIERVLLQQRQDGHKKNRLGIIPGGIAEIFEGGHNHHPKVAAGSTTNAHSDDHDDEYCIVRKGFLRLAYKHNMSVIPVYVFGASKMFRRLHVPFLERLSRWLRVSLVVFYGVCGLPIPFRQRLSYVMGEPIRPLSLGSLSGNVHNYHHHHHHQEACVDNMHQRFCNELIRLFDRHKDAYGWGHKTLKLIKK